MFDPQLSWQKTNTRHLANMFLSERTLRGLGRPEFIILDLLEEPAIGP